jgi:hypothetical protein
MYNGYFSTDIALNTLLGGNLLKKPKLIIPKEITAINLRHNLGEILDQVTNKRAGIPAAILLSVPDYKDLEELADTWYEQAGPDVPRKSRESPPGDRGRKDRHLR